jgi:hypothetical protein
MTVLLGLTIGVIIIGIGSARKKDQRDSKRTTEMEFLDINLTKKLEPFAMLFTVCRGGYFLLPNRE